MSSKSPELLRSTIANDELLTRAASVIPAGHDGRGIYGHMTLARLPEGYPQFYSRALGSRVWDVDDHEYVDLMSSYGPMLVGHRNPRVEAAAEVQRRLGDCLDGPTARMVELAELLTDTVSHADWAMFAKNGTDATTICVMAARAATGRRCVLAARGAYHGSGPWCTPRLDGTVPEDRSTVSYFEYNDLPSLEKALSSVGDDVAAILVTPFRHDAGFDQELVEPEFAVGIRALCDKYGAALIIDDVRCGFRLNFGGSWEPLGVEPDLSAWGKAIANGHSLAAVTGTDVFRDAASRIFVTGSYWYSAVSMAAALETIATLDEEDGLREMHRAGEQLREGLDDQAGAHGLEINQTGPVEMPYLSFLGDVDYELANVFSLETLRRGALLHPRHNWFLSAAHSEQDIDRALDATDLGFAAVRRRLAEQGIPSEVDESPTRPN